MTPNTERAARTGGGSPPVLGEFADLTTDAGATQAEHELNRAELAGSDEALAAWARRWARPALTAIHDGFRDRIDELEVDLADAEAEAEAERGADPDEFAKLEADCERLEKENEELARQLIEAEARAGVTP